jgi:hypothetical protein
MRLLLVLALSSFAFGQHVVSGGHTIKGSHTVSSSGSGAAISQNTAHLLGTNSAMSQTPTIFPSESTIQLDSGPAGLMSAWNTAFYREMVHELCIKAAGGHNDYGGNEGYCMALTLSGGVFSGVWTRLQVSGVDDVPTTPTDMAIANVGNFSLPASGGANCADNGTTHANCKIGPRHQYTGVAYIPPGAVSCNGISGDAQYVVGGITLNTNGSTTASDAWIIPYNSGDSLYPNHLRLDNWWTKTGGTFLPGTDAVAGWYNGSIWIYDAGATGTSGSATLWQHDVCAQTITSRKSLTSDAAFTGTTGVVDRTNGKMLLWYPDTTTSRKLHTVLLSSPYTDLDITSLLDSNCSGLISGGASAGTFWTQYPGMAFNPDKGVIGVYPSYGQDFWEINLATNACTHVTLGGDTIPTAASGSNGTFGRLQYDSIYHVYVLAVTDISKQAVVICTDTDCGSVVNNFASRIAGTNVAGGAAHIVTGSSVDGVIPESFDSAVPHVTGTDEGRGICPDGGACAGIYRDSITTVSGSDKALRISIPAGGNVNFGDFHTTFAGTEFDTSNREFFMQGKIKLGPGFCTLSNWPGTGGSKFYMFTATTGNTCSADPSELVINQRIDNAFNGCLVTLYTTCGISESVQIAAANSEVLDYITGCPHYGDRGITADSTRCWAMQEGEWMTFQIHGKLGTGGSNDSTMEFWAAHEGQTSVLLQNAVDWTFYITSGKWGRVLCLPYMTGMFGAVQDSYIECNDLIVSTRRIPDPDVGTPNAPDSLSLTIVDTTHVTLNWRTNSQNGTIQDDTAVDVYRCTGDRSACLSSQSFTLIASTAAGATTYADSGLTHTQAYTWKIAARNQLGHSADAIAVCAKTSANPCGSTATP